MDVYSVSGSNAMNDGGKHVFIILCILLVETALVYGLIMAIDKIF